MYKRITSIVLSGILISTQAFGAVPAVGDPPIIECQIESESEYFPVGDTSGKSVMTKKDVTRDCNITKTVYGNCIKWEDQKEEFEQGPESYDSYNTANFEDSIGTLMSTLGAYDQIEHLWSGWHGYCEIGTKSDFSWTEDPMFWASLAMSFALSYTGGDAGTAATDGVSNAATETATDSFFEEVGTAISDMLNEMGFDFADDAASEAAAEAVNQEIEKGLDTAAEGAADAIQSVFEEAYKTAFEEYTRNMGRCLAAAAFSTIATAYAYYNFDPNGDGDCDPVDEICGEGSEATDESEIMTMDAVEFNNMVAEYSSGGDDIMQQLVILDDGSSDGIVSFRIRHTNEVAGASEMDTSEMDELKDKLRETQAMIGAGMTAISLAGCLSGISGADAPVSNPTDEQRASLRQGIGAAIGAVSSFIPSPYGPIVALIGKLVLYTATSYETIDSCHSLDDAKECGSRHEKTQKALKYDLCHPISEECAETSMFVGEDGFLQDSCCLDGYHYCCYDQVLTKVLVEQIKAQLGRDWAHCTGITLKDLNYISLQQCSETVMSSYPDGTKFYYKEGDTPPDPTTAFQYQGHCVDMTEFLEYLQSVIGEDVEMEDFKDFWDDITDQTSI